MSLLRKTVFWVLVLALLGGAFFLFDKKSEEKKTASEALKRIFAFETADVFAFVIKKKGSEDVSVRREEGAWVLTSPVNAAGDSEEIERYLEKLVPAKLDGVLFESAPEEKFKEMGLSDPALSVEIITADGSSRTMIFGNAGPTHNISFAAIKGDPRILRINTDIKSEADKESYDMRDKALLKFEPTKARNLDIRWAGGARIFVEQKAEGKWNTLGLPDGGTDFLRLMETVVKFRSTKVRAFVDEDPKDLSAYGLNEPRARIVFTDDGGVKHSIAIGGRDKERRGYYAITGTEKNVVLLEEDLVDSIPRSISDLEEKPDGQSEGKTDGQKG